MKLNNLVSLIAKITAARLSTPVQVPVPVRTEQRYNDDKAIRRDLIKAHGRRQHLKKDKAIRRGWREQEAALQAAANPGPFDTHDSVVKLEGV